MPSDVDGPKCPNWVWSNRSNVHVAKDRGWFTEYAPFETLLGSLHFPDQEPLKIVGIGTVEIPTEILPTGSGQANHGTIRLTNVFHAPSCLCNIIGNPILNDYRVGMDSITDLNNCQIAYFDRTLPLLQVKLRRDFPVGPSVVDHGRLYSINVYWFDSEREKWEARQIYASGYTDEEKAWLKENYGGEFRFLRDYGLSIYKDEDREEGRQLLRSLGIQNS